MYDSEEGIVLQAHNLRTPEAEAGGRPDPGMHMSHSKMLSKNKGREREQTHMALLCQGRGLFSDAHRKTVITQLYCVLPHFSKIPILILAISLSTIQLVSFLLYIPQAAWPSFVLCPS